MLTGEDPTEARIALRSGAFEGLRDNVRHVCQMVGWGKLTLKATEL